MCVVEHFRSADMTASDVAQTWTLVTEEGDLKVYKKETVEDGILIEPHKAVYTVTVGYCGNIVSAVMAGYCRNIVSAIMISYCRNVMLLY